MAPLSLSNGTGNDWALSADINDFDAQNLKRPHDLS